MSRDATTTVTAQRAGAPPTFTVFIPTYNRAHTLPRTLASLERQTFRDFDVLIVDDGSSDETEALVAQWRARQDVPVRYVHQPNRGKHGAHNTALAHLAGELTVPLGSDDMLADDALERLLHHWRSIPPEEREHYAGVEGLCAHMSDGHIAGDRFPRDVMDSDYLTLRYTLGLRGDKKNAIRSDVLKVFPFPYFEGERHVRPSVVWKRMAHHYKFRYVNEVIQFIEYQPGGLSHDRFSLRMRNPRGYRLDFLEDIALHGRNRPLGQRLRGYTGYVRYSLHANAGLRAMLADAPSPWLLALALPGGYAKYLRDRARLARKRKAS